MEDIKIIELFEQRDESAISEVSEKYGTLLKSVAKKITESDADAEECLSDALLRLWQSIPPAKPESLRSYSCKVIRNLALKRLTYNLADKRSANLELPLDELEAVLQDDAAKDAFDSVDFSILLDSFLHSLSQEARVVFLKRYFFMDTVPEISRDLGISESKVKSLLWRARNKLRNTIYRKGV